ncbi:putative DNA primase/helicase [Povalibacter uvarum]|uniref:Putative DNA primase/helicase n=1 Tax=Povalibacter uvarum TaxID=732238 RepID=A0A841HHW1_9GAMM|nr:phage/plasmid primase, P4 family [Povalibacter uvarum]MBB6091900.1 putative DNA primase/helicase [Povalibacter uvarum]
MPYSDDYGTARIASPPNGDDKFRSTTGAIQLFKPRNLRAKKSKSLYIIEGPIKAVAAAAQGLDVRGIGGCWNWQRHRRPIPGLRKLRVGDRSVIPVFDADITENNSVLLAYLLLGDWLLKQGARVKHLRIPSAKGRHTGIDDFLASKGLGAFKKLTRHDWDSEELERLRTSVMQTTEGGLAARFVMSYADDVRYDPKEDEWFCWNGKLWVPQARGRPADAVEAMKAEVRRIVTEANAVPNAERRKRMLVWGAKCDNNGTVKGAMALASTDMRIRLNRAKLDSDPHLLGTANGVLDLRTRQIVESNRDDYVTRRVVVPYDPDAKCPTWKRFLADVLCTAETVTRGKKRTTRYRTHWGLVNFIRRFAGYLLYGGNPDRLIFFLYGEGRNGKSVFIETLLELMGDYGIAAKSELLMQNGALRDSESAQPFMLRLRDTRYITASEVKEGMALDPSTVKTLTGGDVMTCRGLRSLPVQFTVLGKVVVRCNNRVVIDGGDQALWDRVVEIPFNRRIADAEQDKSLRQKLRAELPGILAWAVRGYADYADEGALKLPAIVRKQVADYRYAMDSLSQWMDECVQLDTAAKTLSSDVRSSYERWCERQAMERQSVIVPVSRLELNKKLEASGFVRKESHSQTKWFGLRLKVAE